MKEITEINKVICVFMGDDPEAYFEGELRYHESWNQLMPVVEKIESLGYKFEITEDIAFLCPNDESKEEKPCMGRDGENGSKINAAYNLACDFIQWYNQQQTDK